MLARSADTGAEVQLAVDGNLSTLVHCLEQTCSMLVRLSKKKHLGEELATLPLQFWINLQLFLKSGLLKDMLILGSIPAAREISS